MVDLNAAHEFAKAGNIDFRKFLARYCGGLATGCNSAAKLNAVANPAMSAIANGSCAERSAPPHRASAGAPVGGLRTSQPDCFFTRAIGLPPSAQLLGFCLLSTLEIIVGLQEEKPSTLSIADRTCLLQVFFRLVPQDIDAHAAIPRYLAWSAHLGRQSWQNIETMPLRRPTEDGGKERAGGVGSESRDE